MTSDSPDPRFTNFPFGPVALSPTWRKYRESGHEEAEQIVTSEGIASGSLSSLPGKIMPKPSRVSERSKSELTKAGCAPQEGSVMYTILPDRLYLMGMPETSKRKDPLPRACYYYFKTEKSLRYFPFSNDFGPLHLGNTVKFIRRLNGIISNPDHARCRIVYYCPNTPNKISNAITLLAIYLLCVCKMNVDDILKRLESIPFKPYRDASYGQCYYKMTLDDILFGIHRSVSLGWFDWASFDLATYEHYEMIDNGDLNWIIPNKFIAFSTPMMNRFDDDGYMSSTPDDYVPIFNKFGVTDVVQLNENKYDRNIFTRAGINHHILSYPDGSIPNEARIQQFLNVAENARGAIAVHCKAGLGRTGSMIGIYAIRNFNFTGREWIAWNRICRPGSVLGPQQQWLTVYEEDFNNAVSLAQRSAQLNSDALMSPRALGGGVRSPIYPVKGGANLEEMPTSFNLVQNPAMRDAVLESVLEEDQRKIALEGEKGQAERLVSAKRKNEQSSTPPSIRTPTSFKNLPSQEIVATTSTTKRVSEEKTTTKGPALPTLVTKVSTFFEGIGKTKR